MLKKRRIRAKDRMSVTETVSIDETVDAATADEWRAIVRPIDGTFGGVTWTLRNVEEIWQAHASAEGADDPEEHSPAWYADQILVWVARARDAYASKDFEAYGLSMLRVGRLHEEGRWRLAHAGTERYMRKVRAKSLRAGRRRGRDVHADASKRDARVIDLAHRLRLRRPYRRDTDHSTRWLAREIARRLATPFGTIYKRLLALAIK